jgi:arylsulfatase A-like enzyme
MRRVLPSLLLILAASRAHAAPDAVPAPPSRGLVRVARLAPAMSLTPPAPGLVAGVYVEIDGEPRPALSSVTAMAAPCTWRSDDPTAVCTAPPDTVATPWHFVRLVRKLDDGRVVTSPPVAMPGEAPDRVHRVGPLSADVRTGVTLMGAAISPAPELVTRDLTSDPVVVPPDAVLTVAFGIEQPAWTPDAAPVRFAVTALGDGETVLFEQTLDPARRAEDRRWFEPRIPLGSLAGKTVRFRFTARAVGDATMAASLPVWSEPALLAPPAGDLPLGVVLISLDTMRARSTSSGGAQRPTTPRLDAEIGGNGVIFENAVTTAPHTLPAHTSMLTGLYVRSHGVRSPLTHLAPERTTLTEALQRAGYVTAAVTENGFVVPELGIRRGFDYYRENKSADLHRPDGFAAAIFDDGLTWLAQHRDEPFFLFLHTYQVHYPYVPPPPYDTAFEPPWMLDTYDEVEQLRYEQEIRYIDDEVALFLDGLAALGLRERTLVVITSDHGEEFMEHGQRWHLFQLHDEAVRIPLMMRLPGAVPASTRVPAAVSLVDVAPTVLDLVGLPPLHDVDGTSLVPLLRDGSPPFARDGVFSETISSVEAAEVDVVALRREHTSCIGHLGDGSTQCFDRTVDPDERTPLAAGSPTVTTGAEAIAGFVRSGASAAGGSPVQGDVDPERMEKLKALGYVE